MLPGYRLTSGGQEARMGTIAGSYTTQRDGGITYTYQASWHETGDGIVWSATVKRAGASAGAPTGQIRKTLGAVPADDVRRLVETAIETRAGVRA